MKKEPLISFVLIAYNQEKFIKDAVIVLSLKYMEILK